MSKYFFLIIRSALLASFLLAAAHAQGGPDALKLSEYLAQIQSADPTIQASRFHWEATREAIPAAGALPDPNVSYGYFISNVETRVGAMNQKVGVSQKVPYPRKLRLERDYAKGRSELAHWKYLNLLRHRITMGKIAYINVAYIDERERIVRDQLKLLNEITLSVQAGFETNRNDLFDLLLVKQRLSNLEAELIGIMGERDVAAAMINRLRGTAATTEVGAADYYKVSALPEREALLNHAINNSEALQAGIAATKSANDAFALASAQDLPDVTLGIDYTEINRNTFSNPSGNGRDAVMAYFSVSIPIWRSKYDALESSARKRLSSARANEQAVRSDVAMETVQAWTRADTILQQMGIYETTLIPQAEQAYRSTVSAFASGKASSSVKWLEAQDNILKAELGLAHLHADFLKAIAELERITAIELSLVDVSVRKN